MLDTVVFNRALDNADVLALLGRFPLRATHIQIDEIKQTKDQARRADLLSTFEDLDPKPVRTSSAVWDVSRWDASSWGDQDGLFQQMLDALKVSDRAAGKKLRDDNNQRHDVLIAETAIRHDFALITEDRSLAAVASDFGGRTFSLDEIKKAA